MKKFHLTQSLRFFVKASTVASSSISAALWCSTSWGKQSMWKQTSLNRQSFTLA